MNSEAPLFTAQASANVFSLSRPLHPLLPQTKQLQDLEDYAYKHDIQACIWFTCCTDF